MATTLGQLGTLASINDIASSVTLIVVVAVGVFVFVRDKFLEVGFSRPRWLVRTSQRAATRRIARDTAFLDSEFFEHMFVEHVGNAVEIAGARKKLPSNALNHPDRMLISALKGWTIKLTDNAEFHGLHHYVNTMGAITSSEDLADEFAMIAHAWLAVLQKRNEIPPFDCILSIKDGNPILVHRLAQRMDRSASRPIRAVFCKGAGDRAKVVPGIHETDFEGLLAFRDQKPLPRCGEKYRAIAVDDNCTTGKSLADAIQHFNRFVKQHPDDYPFHPVDTAVVLFVVKTSKANELVENDIGLHALLALGDKEMETILRAKRRRTLTRNVHKFKSDDACRESRALNGGAENNA